MCVYLCRNFHMWNCSYVHRLSLERYTHRQFWEGELCGWGRLVTVCSCPFWILYHVLIFLVFIKDKHLIQPPEIQKGGSLGQSHPCDHDNHIPGDTGLGMAWHWPESEAVWDRLSCGQRRPGVRWSRLAQKVWGPSNILGTKQLSKCQWPENKWQLG